MNQKEYSSFNKVITFYLRLFTVSIGIIVLITLSSCVVHELSTEPDNDRTKIKGSGKTVSEVRELPNFNSITMNTAGLVKITSGENQYLEITVDENVLEYIKVYVEEEVLIIEIEEKVSISNFELTVDIVMTDLRSLVTNSAGSIRSLNQFEEDKINLMINSAGSISLDLKANQLNSMINSAGSLFLRGQVTHHNTILSSAGNVSAFDLGTETTTVLINSAGNAHVNVSELLDVTINSVGCVYYKGNPQIIQNINSIGCVISAN
jgi:hypothetical protein